MSAPEPPAPRRARPSARVARRKARATPPAAEALPHPDDPAVRAVVRGRARCGRAPRRSAAPIGTARIHPTRAQSREERPDRRKPHGVCPRLRPAVRVGPRRRAPLRHARGLPQLRQAHLCLALAAPLGRHGVRAGRRAGQQAPPRHGVRAHPLLRQAVHGLGHERRARRRFHRDVPAAVRGRLRRESLRDPRQRQRQFAARARR